MNASTNHDTGGLPSVEMSSVGEYKFLVGDFLSRTSDGSTMKNLGKWMRQL